MKKHMQWMFAAILMTSGNMILTSCSDDDHTNSGNDHTDYNIEEPATDQLGIRVTANLPAASLSQFDEKSTGAALIKRLPRVTSAIQEDTKFVLVKGSDAGNLSDAVINQMAQILVDEGYLAIETPTEQQLNSFFDRIDKGLAAIVEDYVDDIFDLTPEQKEATVRASMAGRMTERKENLNNYMRGTASDAACAEMVILGATDYFFMESDNVEDKIITYATDTDGNIVEKPTEISYQAGELTAYRYGLYADGAAQWLNDTESEKDTEKDTEKTQSRASRRASSNMAVNDLESACETFTHHQNINYKTSANKFSYKPKACQTTLSYWGVHNMSSNRDYYYVSQKVVLSLGANNGTDLFYARGQKSDFWLGVAPNWKNYDLMYGNYLTKYETSMNLKGDKGIIKGEAATPETANQTITQSINLTTSSSTSSTNTDTYGFTLGVTSASVTASVNGGGSATKGKTNGTSFAMGNSKSIKDLSVVKNTANTKTTWIYSGKDVQVSGKVGKWEHDIVADILVNDANLMNDACWSVENPSGEYTLEVQSQPEVGMLLIYNNSTNRVVERTKTPIDTYTHKLKKPNRYLQTWRMFIVINEWMDGIKYYSNAQTNLENDFKRNFSDIFSDVFTVCESEENSVLLATSIIKHAKRVLDANKDQLPGIAEGRGVKQFTIYWRCDNTNIKLRNAYVVRVE